ncbi:MAG: DUF1501 domain-containing protein [Planctomycetales bacterium]
MFTLFGPKSTCCDGFVRRDFLRAGALALGGLTLPRLLAERARAAESGQPVRQTSVIFIELAGGPTQFETWDPKPNAPAEYRGELSAISTRLPGVQFCELMAEQAKVADKLAVLRSVKQRSTGHDTAKHVCHTGYYLRDELNQENEMPSTGAIVAKLRGGNAPGLPAHVGVLGGMKYADAVYLGAAYNPFTVRANPAAANFKVDNLDPAGGMNFDRLADRRGLLAKLDEGRRIVDNRNLAGALDQFTAQAFEMVTSPQARRAFDIAREPDSTRDRYGRTRTGQGMLLARRLVEAGVTFVSINVGGWDDHANMLPRLKPRAIDFDRGMAALACDIHERGIDRDVLVIAMGEFGRTPKINGAAGRDHWSSVSSMVVSGGGLKMGQVIGSSNARGEVPTSSPYEPENVLATMYRHLGIDPALAFDDYSGRPRYVLEKRDIVRELV